MSYRLWHNGCPLRRLPFAKISALRRRGILKRVTTRTIRGDLERFGVTSFILDITWQRVYERCCLVAPHVLRSSRRN